MTRPCITVKHLAAILACLSFVLSSLLLAGSSNVLAQGPNLLQNPGFERPYVAPIPGKENCFIAAPWVPWYIEGSREEVNQGYRLVPEYKAAFRADFPGNRVRNGELSQQWFHSFGNFQAGVLQQVHNIPVGAKLRFELWGMTWSCDRESKGNCGGARSGDPSPMHFRIGIDPYGGVDIFSSNVVWSPEQNAYDAWHLFQVEAIAQKPDVTVFVYSYPDYRSQDNNVYVDDASLVVVTPPPTPTRKPTNTPLPTPVPTEAPPTPLPTPTQVLLPTAVPTNVPPTCPPTLVAKPAPTCPPVVMPTPAPPPSLASQLMSGQGLIALLGGLAAIVAAFFVGLSIGRGK